MKVAWGQEGFPCWFQMPHLVKGSFPSWAAGPTRASLMEDTKGPLAELEQASEGSTVLEPRGGGSQMLALGLCLLLSLLHSEREGLRRESEGSDGKVRQGRGRDNYPWSQAKNVLDALGPPSLRCHTRASFILPGGPGALSISPMGKWGGFEKAERREKTFSAGEQHKRRPEVRIGMASQGMVRR